MKTNIGKYIFITIVLILIFSSLYIFFANKKAEDTGIENKNNISETQYSKTLNIAIYNFDSINPILSQNKDVINISKLIFQPLIELDENYKIQFKLAKECVKIEGKKYIIKLNNNIQWQDGQIFTAKDVEYTINEIKKIESSIYYDEAKNIENIEIIDDYTLKINLKNIDNFLKYHLTFPILANHIYENEDLKTSNIIPLGTGCFKIKQLDSKDTSKIILKKNQYYKNNNENNENNEDGNGIEEINILLYNNMNDIYNNFKIDNIDIIHTASSNFREYIGNINYNIKEYKGREYEYLSLNCKDEILSKKEVRQALSYSINKSRIISEIGNYYIANFPLDYTDILFQNEDETYNIEKAKEILQNENWNFQNNKWQKYSNGKLLTLSLNMIVQSENSQRLKVAEEIKKQLQEIGIIINIKQVSNSKYEMYLKDKDYQLILTGINNGFSPSLEYFYGDNNLAQYENTDLRNQIREIDEYNIASEKYNNYISTVYKDCAYIGLYRNKEMLILSQNVNGEILPNNYSIFYNIYTWKKVLKN